MEYTRTKNRYMLYRDNYYVVIGHGTTTRTMYNGKISNSGDVYICILASKYNEFTAHHSRYFQDTIEISVKEAIEVTDKETLKILDLLYG